MNILIVGGAGFLGANLAHFLFKKYPSYHLVVLDNLSSGNRRNLADLEKISRFKFVEGDVCVEETVAKIFEEENVQIVINLASKTEFESEERVKTDFLKTDLLGNFNLLEESRKKRIFRYLYISSQEVYGKQKELERDNLRPFSETDPLFPVTPLAASQAGAELLVSSYFQAYALPIIILRVANIFGPYQPQGTLIDSFIKEALRNKPLLIPGDGRGQQDYVYVNDFCGAIDLVLQAKGVEGEIYNLGGGFEYNVLEVAELTLMILGKSKSLVRIEKKEKFIYEQRLLDSTKFRTRFGWRPQIEFNEGLEKTINWYKERMKIT